MDRLDVAGNIRFQYRHGPSRPDLIGSVNIYALNPGKAIGTALGGAVIAGGLLSGAGAGALGPLPVLMAGGGDRRGSDRPVA